MGRDPFLTERTEQRPTGETQRQGAGKLYTSSLIETGYAALLGIGSQMIGHDIRVEIEILSVCTDRFAERGEVE